MCFCNNELESFPEFFYHRGHGEEDLDFISYSVIFVLSVVKIIYA